MAYFYCFIFIFTEILKSPILSFVVLVVENVYLLLPELGCAVARISTGVLNHCCEGCSKWYIKMLYVYFPFQDLHDLLGNLSQGMGQK